MQLLEKPLTLEEFNESKFINPYWFFKGFSNVPKLKKDNEYYYFVYNKNTKNWNVNLLYCLDNLTFKAIAVKRIDQDGKTFLRFDKKQLPKHSYFNVDIYVRK